MARKFSAMLFFLSLLLLSGCVNTHTTIGQRRDTAKLEKELRLGVSTRRDIVSILGEPNGKGNELLFTGESIPRTVWSYYHEEGTQDYAQRLYVFIFLKEDVYDGYLWFSSLK